MDASLTIALRVYPGINKVPAFYSEDKLKLFGLSLRSLASGLEGVDYRVVVILDNCPREYEELVAATLPQGSYELLPKPGIGNYGTYELQIDLLSESESEFVFFGEDDYLYRPGAFAQALAFMRSSEAPDFLSLYDHLDYYRLPLHDHPVELTEYGGQHWRSADSTTLSFLTTPEVVRETREVLLSFTRGCHDAAMWMALTKRHLFNPVRAVALYRQAHRYGRWIYRAWQYNFGQVLFGRKRRLYAPVPALATHLDEPLLAPGVDWNEVAARFE